MNRAGVARLVGLLVVLALVSSVDARAAGLQAKVERFRHAGAALRVALDLRDVFPDRFRRVIEQGGTLYVRIEAELWQSRSLWDRLVRPAIVSVARLTRDAAGHGVVLVDRFGEATAYPSFPPAVIVWADLVPISRVEDASDYYVHATVTVGTVAEDEISGVSGALFGDERQSSGLGALGKYVFQNVLRLADYLDSVSCSATSGRLSGRQLNAAPVSRDD